MGIKTRKRVISFVIYTCLAWVSVSPAWARFQVSIPVNAQADSLLNEGLEAFKQGDYSTAESSFRRVVDEFFDNRATTAAIVMSAKAAYRQGLYDRTRSYVSGFAATYGTSSYAAEARHLDEIALEAIRYGEVKTASIGVIFSLDRDERQQTQDIFNGVRLAVDAYNEAGNVLPVRMIYRDIDGGANAARRAVEELAALGVSAIIGTLFSEEALAAADEAERTKTVFMAPLATDDDLTTGRSFTFQANPSMKSRGSAMARFVVNGLRLDSIAVILSVDDRKISERLADGFLEEASRLGAHIQMVHILPDENAMFRLAEVLPSDTLKNTRTVYIPLASRNPITTIGAILSNLDRLNPSVRVIGNESWQDLPQKSHASTYTTTYGDEFWLDSTTEEFKTFERDFKSLAKENPERLGITGFDVASFLLEALIAADGQSGQELAESIRSKGMYQGLGIRLHFDGGNTSQALFYLRYRDNQLTLIR